MLSLYKKFLTVLLIFVFSVLLISFSKFPVVASNDDAIIHIFSSKYCPHCREAEKFLEELKVKQPELKIYKYEVSFQQNSQLLNLVASKLEVSGQGVPFILINNQSLIGFSTATSAEIYKLLDLESSEPDLIIDIIRQNQLTPIIEEIELGEVLADQAEAETEELNIDSLAETSDLINQEIDLPLFGRLNLEELSLPILTIMIGFLDGFNPCAMWVLIFLISLLMGMEDRRRMWLLGSVFILASGFVYFLFMSAWLNFFLFIGLVDWIRMAIAALAVFVAIHYLRDFFKNKDGACQVDLGGNKQKIFAKLKEVVYRKNLIWSLLGIVILAFSVNLLELVCSAGLPAVYTKVLSMSDLASWQYYSYLWLYILVFMLDDLVVFAIAMISMKKVALNTKYARYSHLIGGIIMLILGFLMFFKPEWIMFG